MVCNRGGTGSRTPKVGTRRLDGSSRACEPLGPPGCGGDSLESRGGGGTGGCKRALREARYAPFMRFLGIDPDLDRPRLQAMRASPPALAEASGARRRVFGAALGQWDALLGASASVAPAASPILLFYALSQAGRAVCAAHTSGQPWQSRGHGLSIGDPGKPIGETPVRPEGSSDSSFAMFCGALGAEPLSEPTTLGRLWAANRHLERVDGLGLGDPEALQLTVIGPAYMGGSSLHAQITGDLAAHLPADLDAAAVEPGSDCPTTPEQRTGLS